jgi:hypothetical protein
MLACENEESSCECVVTGHSTTIQVPGVFVCVCVWVWVCVCVCVCVCVKRCGHVHICVLVSVNTLVRHMVGHAVLNHLADDQRWGTNLQVAEVVVCSCHPLLRRQREPLGRLFVALLHPTAIHVHDGEVVLPSSVPGFGGCSVPPVWGDVTLQCDQLRCDTAL